jgi:hypothetical protein
MSRIIYLTYADQPSGVYSSQVCDVVNFMNNRLNAGIRLVAFVSLRQFAETKKRIRSEVKDAIVLPMIPKANYWQCSLPLLMLICLATGTRSILARGVLACNLALLCKKAGMIRKAGYDGRGAIAAEWAEYDVVPYPNLKNTIHALEQNAVMKSDFRISVSGKLVEYWRERFGYAEEKHVVVPCLVNSGFAFKALNKEEKTAIRQKYRIPSEAFVLVYSGSVSGWQSFGLVKETLAPLLHESKNAVLLFLSPPDKHIDEMQKEFPGRVFRAWVKHQEVTPLLSACDYGVLIRESSVTNRVASPTKFAEYLGAGLPVIISEGIGDYAGFVRKNRCGVVLADSQPVSTAALTPFPSETMALLVQQYFTKEAHRDAYRKVIAALQ